MERHANIAVHQASDGRWWWKVGVRLKGAKKHTVSIHDSIGFTERDEAIADAEYVCAEFGIQRFDVI